jgi:hypothetical protein
MRHFATRVGVVALAAASMIALAGCTAPANSAGSSSTPTTPTSTSASGKPTLSQLVASPDGLGYLAVGSPVPDKSAATAILTYKPTKCVSAPEGISATSPGAGAWVPAYPTSLIWSGSGLPFDVGPTRASTDPIGVIEIWSPEIKTAKGVGAGSTPAQLRKAYGTKLTVSHADNSDVYVLKGARSELLFEVAKAEAGLNAAETNTVVWMRIVPLGTSQLHIANTDSAGPCSF